MTQPRPIRAPVAWRLARRLMALPRFKGRDRALLLLRPHLHRHHGLVACSLPNGTLVNCALTDEIDARLYVYRTYEPISTGVLEQCVRTGDVVVDAGANIGYFSLVLARAVGPRGAVHSFEPHPTIVERLRNNVRANRLTNVLVRPEALGDTTATVHLVQEFANRSGDSSLRHRGRAPGTAIAVPQIRLDDYCTARRLTPDVIKIDVEGAELRVLEGASALLARRRPILVVEHNASTAIEFGYLPADMLAWLQRRFGYQLYWIGPTRLIEYDDARGPAVLPHAVEAQNILALPAEVAAERTRAINRHYPRPPSSYSRLELWPPHPGR